MCVVAQADTPLSVLKWSNKRLLGPAAYVYIRVCVGEWGLWLDLPWHVVTRQTTVVGSKWLRS